LWEVRVAIDQSGKNGDHFVVEPADGCGARSFSQIVIGADFRDPAIGDDDGAIAVAAERTVSGRVNQEPADSEGIGLGFHGSVILAELTANRARKGQICPQKKGFGQRTRRNNKYEKRAAARIALTCVI
jgi:hypothetical protein